MKKIIITFGVFILLNIFYFTYYRYPKENYEKKVSESAYDFVLHAKMSGSNLLSVVPESDGDESSNKLASYGSWNSYLFSNQRVQNTNIKGKTKVTTTRFRLLLVDAISENTKELDITDVDFCEFTFATDTRLFCLNKFLKMKYFDNDLIGHKVYSLEKAWGSVIDVISASEKEVWIIWRDERARWYTTNAFVIMGVGAGETRDGPWLVMAGKLNLDTLEFEEYVIKYDSQEFP